MSELPRNWTETRIGEIALYVQRGKSPKYTDRSDLPVINQKCIRWHGIDKVHVKYIHPDQWCKWGVERYLNEGDILWNSTGTGTIGRACVYKKSYFNQAVVDSHVTIVRFDRSKINPDYVFHFIASPFVQKKIEEMQSGSTNQVELGRGAIVETSIPLPPFNEQKRIVAKIEELFSELDKGIESLKTAREQLKVYRQAVLKHAFEGKLIKKTTVWGERSVKQITTYITSGSRGWAQYYADSGDLFIRAQNLKFDRLDLTDIAFVNIPNNAEGARTKIQKGDLLITITGANVTKSALVESEIGTAYVSQHVALCRLTDEVFSRFFYWFMVAESAGRKQLSKAAYGAGKPGLNLDNIKDVKVLLPSYEEQVSIVEIIEEKLSVCEKFERDIESQIDNCTALRQSILKQAFSGKLVAQDPRDEPASVLLERIKAEKNGDQKRKKKVA
jgi:type I restriction enzyme S subunit